MVELIYLIMPAPIFRLVFDLWEGLGGFSSVMYKADWFVMLIEKLHVLPDRIGNEN